MHCERNERLLALHAGGDLPDRQERALSAHLRACDACRRLASDFAAARELLGTHEPPEFDEAFFDAVRRNVLREIDDSAPPPAFARLTALLFGRRPLALAACVAILVALGAAGLLLRGGRGGAGDAPRQLADSGGDARRESGAAPGIDKPATRGAEIESKPAATIVVPPPHRKQFVVSTRTPRRAKREARVAEPATPVLVEVAASGGRQAQSAASPGVEAAPASEVAVLDAPAERKMLRIELQTGDPNVRIIWLTPQGPEKLPR